LLQAIAEKHSQEATAGTKPLREFVVPEGDCREAQKKDHPRHLTSKPAGLKYRQFPANSPELLDQGVQHPDL
jgi:hypothetical protein